MECDPSHNHCAAMLAVSEAAKSIYVVYKSSNMDKQLITEVSVTFLLLGNSSDRIKWGNNNSGRTLLQQ